MEEIQEGTSRVGRPIDETDNDLCRALWLAVLVQAMMDAGKDVAGGANRLERAQAMEWFAGRDGEGGDFATVCDLAGVDPRQTRRMMLRMLRGEIDGIDFRCMKKPVLKNRSTENRRRYFLRARRSKQMRPFAVGPAFPIPDGGSGSGQGSAPPALSPGPLPNVTGAV